MSKLVKVAISVSLSREYLLKVPRGWNWSLEELVRQQVNVPHSLNWEEDEFSVINLDEKDESN